MKESKTKWSDQPAFLEDDNAELLFPGFKVGEAGTAQIFFYIEQYYFTCGDLFSSQTLRIKDLATLGKFVYELTYMDIGENIDVKEWDGVDLLERYVTVGMREDSLLDCSTSRAPVGSGG